MKKLLISALVLLFQPTAHADMSLVEQYDNTEGLVDFGIFIQECQNTIISKDSSYDNFMYAGICWGRIMGYLAMLEMDIVTKPQNKKMEVIKVNRYYRDKRGKKFCVYDYGAIWRLIRTYSTYREAQFIAKLIAEQQVKHYGITWQVGLTTFLQSRFPCK